MLWKLSIIVLVGSVIGSPLKDEDVDNFVNAVSECADDDTSTLCLKEKASKLTERLAATKELDLFEGMTLVNIGSARSAKKYEALSDDPQDRERQLDERITANVADFFYDHAIQVKLTEDKESRDLSEEARGKKKKKIKQLLPLFLLLKLKLAALIPLFLGIIAFVAVKAVFLGKIAFAMSAFSLIRKLLAKGGGGHAGNIGYAPSAGYHHHDDHPGYNYEPAQGWSRNNNDAQNLAYSGQANN